jgi:hypothetical protein
MEVEEDAETCSGAGAVLDGFNRRGEPNAEAEAEKARTLAKVEVELERSFSLSLPLSRSSPFDGVDDMLDM